MYSKAFKLDSIYRQMIRGKLYEETGRKVIRCYVTSCLQCSGKQLEKSRENLTKYNSSASRVLQNHGKAFDYLQRQEFSSSTRIKAFAKDLFLGKFNKVKI